MSNMDERLDGNGTDGGLSERIEAAISEGIRRGQAKQARRRMRARRRLGGALAACFLLFACGFTIRVSPAFASLVREIPGFEKFVDLIRSTQDEGVRLAVDNDFVQPIGVSDEREGMKFTVSGVIADDSRMVLFYEIQLPDKGAYALIGDFRLTDASSGKEVPAMISYQYPEEMKQDTGKTGVQRGTADFNLDKNVMLPEELKLNVTLKTAALPDASAAPGRQAGLPDLSALEARSGPGKEFQVAFRVDRARFADLRREYALNQTVEMEGQSIVFAKAVVSPLKVSLYLDYDGANGKQIFGPGDIRLVDDEGKEWRNFSGSLEKDHPVYHFESPYFNEPKALYVEGTWFRALDKDKLELTVDLDKRKLSGSPDDKLSLYGVSTFGDHIRLDFMLRGLPLEDKNMYALLEDEFTDGRGNKHRMASLSQVSAGHMTYSDEQVEQHAYYYLENKAYPQPLTFRIQQYPDYIRQPYRLQIK